MLCRLPREVALPARRTGASFKLVTQPATRPGRGESTDLIDPPRIPILARSNLTDTHPGVTNPDGTPSSLPINE